MKCYQYLWILLCLLAIFYIVCTLLRSLIEQERPANKNISKTLLQKLELQSNNSINANLTHVNIHLLHSHHNRHHILHQTFFTLIKQKYSHLIVDNNNKIPTDIFLNYSSDAFSIFDNFGSIAFSQVKENVIGNIVKLRAKYSTDPIKFSTLQDIIQNEVDEKTTHVENSSTDALMWLIRSFWLLKEFLFQFSSQQNPNFSDSVSIAYDSTIKTYHNWIIQNIFSMAMGGMPKTDEFLRDLALDPEEYLANKEQFNKQIFEDMKQTVNDIGFYIENIKKFYDTKSLNIF